MRTALKILSAVLVGALLEPGAGAASVSEFAAASVPAHSTDPTTLERSRREPPAAAAHAASPQDALRPDRRTGAGMRSRPVTPRRGPAERGNATALLKALNAPARRAATARPPVRRSAAATPHVGSAARVQDSTAVPPATLVRGGAASAVHPVIGAEPVTSRPVSRSSPGPTGLVKLGGPPQGALARAGTAGAASLDANAVRRRF